MTAGTNLTNVFALCLSWSRSCLHHACVVLALIEVVQSSDRWCNASGCCIVMWEKKWIWQKRWTNPLCWRLAIIIIITIIIIIIIIIIIFDKSVGQTLSVGGSQYVKSDDNFTTKEPFSVRRLWIDHHRLTSHECEYVVFSICPTILMMVMLLDKTTGQRLNE